jgi:hypothetical protein
MEHGPGAGAPPPGIDTPALSRVCARRGARKKQIRRATLGRSQSSTKRPTWGTSSARLGGVKRANAGVDLELPRDRQSLIKCVARLRLARSKGTGARALDRRTQVCHVAAGISGWPIRKAKASTRKSAPIEEEGGHT